MIDCVPYAGKKTQIPDIGLGMGPNVVAGLVDAAKLPPGSKVTAGNLFISLDLCDYLTQQKIGVLGTVRQNRLHSIDIPSREEASKMSRGDFNVAYVDNDKVVLAWKDSSVVNFASNYADIEPVGTCRRYVGSTGKDVDIAQPNAAKLYSSTMGGVDNFSQTVNSYAIKIKSRKWYSTIYNWYLNVQMVQAWRLYNRVMKMSHSDTISLLDFIRDCVELSILVNSESTSIPSQLPSKFSEQNKMVVRRDQGNHLIISTEKQNVCKNCAEKFGKQKRTKYRCQRCNCGLHPDCFLEFHK